MSLPLFKSLIYSSFILVTLVSAQPPNTIKYNGKDYFINGMNVPWNSFGSDVGTHYEWGKLYKPQFFKTFFEECKKYGVNCARLWIHCDGRSSPEFDNNGSVKGLDSNFFSDFDDIFKIADDNNVMLMPCLWSFDMTKDFTNDAGKYAGMHADLITDTLKTRSYLDNALIPMVKRYANTGNLFAWEIINEPEWSMEGSANTKQVVTVREMQRFCAMITEAIHLHSDKMVTVGSACLKWNSTFKPAENNYWSDSSLKSAYNKSEVYLDFYQIHYYDWMYGGSDWPGYNPFRDGQSPGFWKLDKPVLIGETPGKKEGHYTVKEMVSATFDNGYAGIMPWSYFAKDGHGEWDSCKNELKEFRDTHPSLVDYISSIENDYQKKKQKQPFEINIYSNFINKNSFIELYDVKGRVVAIGQPGEGMFLIRKRIFLESACVYKVRLLNGDVVSAGKFIVGN